MSFEFNHWGNMVRERDAEIARLKKELEEARRPVGEWIDKKLYYLCSHCSTGFNDELPWITNGLPKYCPECGAIMKGDKHEGE